MQLLHRENDINFDEIEVDSFWNEGDTPEDSMHKIHIYPAKFPSFIVQKAISLAKNKYNIKVQSVADVFCGCGTVALEARKNNIEFWGWDINPVATMIAKVKGSKYDINKLLIYYDRIVQCYSELEKNGYKSDNERINYWFFPETVNELTALRESIYISVPEKSKYRLFFLCAFSNILKPTSKWLTKSIKPQVDPYKKIPKTIFCFKKQFNFMLNAQKKESNLYNSDMHIFRANSLEIRKSNLVDLIISSPPYVTSYEYADLHQLSSLWLGYTDDYRELRKNSVGSSYCNNKHKNMKLNKVGNDIIMSLEQVDKSKARSVAKYYYDMEKASKICFNLLKKDSIALFVMGNTNYKGIPINNAKHLVMSLYEVGFSDVYISKRKISGKILTPYREENGRFSSSSNKKNVYGEEFVIVGVKN